MPRASRISFVQNMRHMRRWQEARLRGPLRTSASAGGGRASGPEQLPTSRATAAAAMMMMMPMAHHTPGDAQAPRRRRQTTSSVCRSSRLRTLLSGAGLWWADWAHHRMRDVLGMAASSHPHATRAHPSHATRGTALARHAPRAMLHAYFMVHARRRHAPGRYAARTVDPRAAAAHEPTSPEFGASQLCEVVTRFLSG